MNIENVISDVVTQYGWEILSVDEIDSHLYFATMHNNAYGMGVGFYIEFNNPDDTYSNSYWTLDAVDYPIVYNHVDVLVSQMSRIWFEIEDTFSGVNYLEIEEI